MRLKYFIVVVLFAITGSLYAQTLQELVQHIKKVTETDKLNPGQYLEMTKRFGKYDMHPAVDYIPLPGKPDSLAARNVNSFVFGIIAHEALKLSRHEAQVFTSVITKDAAKNKNSYINEYFWKNRFLFLSLVYDINKNKGKFFSQRVKTPKDSYLRIDNVYKENKKYWKFSRQENAIFDCSIVSETLKKFSFTADDQSILQRMSDYNLYAAYKDSNRVVLVVTGVLDNTLGFIYSPEPPQKESFSPALHITYLEPAGENFYFYVSD